MLNLFVVGRKIDTTINLHVTPHSCSLRGNSGGLNADQKNYVTGHARRFLTADGVKGKASEL